MEHDLLKKLVMIAQTHWDLGATPPPGLMSPMVQLHLRAQWFPCYNATLWLSGPHGSSLLLGIVGSAVPPLSSVGPIVYSCLCVHWVLWCSSDLGLMHPVVQLHLWAQ